MAEKNYIEDSKRMTIVDEDGTEVELEILFTFEDTERFKKKYVLFTNPADEEGNVDAAAYDDDGNLFPIEDPAEWEMVEEVFGAFIDEFEGEEDEEA